MTKRVIVIGGGASGMTAAIFAARQGAAVTLLEHTDRVGKKLLSTGNGRCNLSNVKMDALCYRSGEADFPMKVIGQFGADDAVRFFEELGIVIRDRDGYLYPYSGQASSVLDVLRLELERQKVTVITACETERITASSDARDDYRIETNRGVFGADALILAAGSKAAPSTGSDGSGYRLAEELGHTIVRPLPALVQLKCREKFFKQIAGVRAEVRLSLLVDGEKLCSDEGELQLTDYGISGIVSFQVSRFASRALDRGRTVTAVIDFYPAESYEETFRRLSRRKELGVSKVMEDFFTGWFNKKLALLFLKLAGIAPSRRTETVREGEFRALADLIKHFCTEITGTNPFASAQVCCGGVHVGEIDPQSMESRKHRGLYLAGELLDVDGICGGYNLQWAWSTGAIAGIHAGRKK